MTCAVQAYEYLVDVVPNAFHQPVGFSDFGAIRSEINPCTNTITDILCLVLISVLLTPCNNVLHFRFREAYIQRVGLLFFLTFQVLTFIICELILVLVGKAFVKVGFDLLVKGVIYCSLVGHSCELHNFAFGRSAPPAFCIFHNGISFVFISAYADFFMTAVQSFRGLGCPQQAFCIFVRVRRKIQCLLFFLRCYFSCADAHFSPAVTSLSAGFWCFSSEFPRSARPFSPPLCRRLFFLTLMRDTLISADGFILIYLSAVIAQLGRQSGENIS